MKFKGFVNFFSKIGIRAVVFAAVGIGSVMVLFSGYSMYEQLYTQNRAFSSGSLSYDEGTSLVEVQESFSKEREDYRAWLRISATHIDYPVMQGKDDLYYANHDVDGNSSLSGAIYLSAANAKDLSDNYLVVFGHHMDNGAMFGDLDRFLDKDFFESHRSGEIVSPGGAYDIEFFAVLQTDAYDDMVYQTGSKNLDGLIAYVGRKANIFKSPDDSVKKIIALSTCAGATTNGRLVVFGVMTEQEKPTPTPTEVANVSPIVTGDPVVTKSPDITNTPVPTGASITPTPDITETPTPTETPAPTEAPVITEEPTGTPTPTVAPATPTPTVPVEDNTPDRGKKKSWIDRVNDWFTPNGSSYGENAWALLNLICLIVTFYVFCPLHSVHRKFRRIGMMRKFNLTKSALWNAEGLDPAGLAERERIMTTARGLFHHDNVTSQEFDKTVEHLFYQVGSFTKRFITGIVLEVVILILAIITFIKTENMRQPMILIDKWTALMLLYVILCCIADWFLARYRAKKNA